MIAHALTQKVSEERDALAYGIAYAMRRNYLRYNKDTVADETILKDLTEMSEGQLTLNDFELPHTKTFGIVSTEKSKSSPKNKNKKTTKSRRFRHYGSTV